MDEVEYREIEGFPGYLVGNDGSVWSNRRRKKGWRRLRLGLSGRQRVYGYVRLCAPGRHRRWVAVHRLVLEAFVGPQPAGMETCHNDGDPFNNQVGNLRWDTHRENVADCTRHGRKARKLTEAQVLLIRELHRKGVTQTALSAQFNVCQPLISCIVRGHAWKHV